MKRATVLEEAFIPVAELLEVVVCGQQLVGRAWKVFRETAAGESSRDLGQEVSCSADCGDIGTCESTRL